jgi:hypothetical protein
MNWYHREPTLNEILSDSIVRAVMEADGIDPRELEATLRAGGQEAGPARPCRAGRGQALAFDNGQSTWRICRARSF